MVHQKYIKRGGKVYGPYYYSNSRKDGQIVTKYIGKGSSELKANKDPEKLQNFSRLILKLFPLFIALILVFGSLLVIKEIPTTAHIVFGVPEEPASQAHSEPVISESPSPPSSSSPDFGIPENPPSPLVEQQPPAEQNLTTQQEFQIQGDISSCQNLNSANMVYTLTQNVNSSATCITIGANNVTLDCAGYKINYTQISAGHGVSVSGYNQTTVKNCNIIGGSSNNWNSYGINIDNGAINASILNNNITTFGDYGYGILVQYSNYASIQNNLINTSGGDSNSVFLNQGSNNLIYNNQIQATGGYASTVFLLNSNNNNLSNNIVGIPSSSSRDNANFWLSGSSNNIMYNNKNLNLAYLRGYGFYLGGTSNNSILNNNITVFSEHGGDGIFLESSNGIIIINNNLTFIGTDNGWGDIYGIYLTSSSNNIFKNNSVLFFSDQDFHSITNSLNNTVTNLYLRSVNVSFTSSDISIKSVNISLMPADQSYKNISKYINITNNSAFSWAYVNFSYNDVNIPSGVDKWTLKIYRYNGTNWTVVPGSSVDTVNRIVYGNITNQTGFSIFAPMGGESTLSGPKSDGWTNNAIYYVTSDIQCPGICFDINDPSSNVTIDCQGHLINYSTTGTGYFFDDSGSTNLTVKNCRITEAVRREFNNYGALFQGTTGFTFINNTFISMSNYGKIWVFLGSDCVISDNNITTYGDTFAPGIYLETQPCNVSNNIIKSNSSSAIYITGSNPVILSYNSINSSLSMGVEGSSNIIFIGNNITSYAEAVLFDSNNLLINNTLNSVGTWDLSASGSNNIATNLMLRSANVSFVAEDINIDAKTSGLAADGSKKNISKYVNVTSSNPVFMNISYSDSDVSGVSESSLKIYRYNGTGWELVPGSGVNTTANYVYGNVTSFSIFAPMGEPPLTCQDLTTENQTYTLGNNVNSSGTCFNIKANNVTIDCAGYIINYSQSAVGYGVNSTGYNYTTVKNCNIVQGSNSNANSYAIYLRNVNNSLITNNNISTSSSSSFLIWMRYSNNSNINANNLTSTGSSSHGIQAWYNANLTFSGNSVFTTGDGSIGIYPAVNTNMTIANNFVVTKGNANGIEIRENPIVINNTVYVYGNSYALYVQDPASNIVNNTVLSNKTWDFYSLSASQSNVTNLYLKNINISFNSSAVAIDVVSGIPIGAGNISRYINITNISDSSWIDIIIQYNHSDIGSLNESRLKLYRYDGSVWRFVSGSGVDAINNLVYGSITTSLGFGVFAPLSDAPLTTGKLGGFTENTVYTLANNISCSGICFSIDANNVTLDCQGYTINYSQSAAGIGVNSTGYDHTTVKNCNIVQGSSSSNSPAIYLGWGNNSLITNNTITTSSSISDGVYFRYHNNSIISNNKILIQGTSDGIKTVYGVNTTATSNNITLTGSGGYGIHIQVTYNSSITHNFVLMYGDSGAGINIREDSLVLNNTVFTYGLSNALYSEGSNNQIINNTVFSNKTWEFSSRFDSQNNVTNLMLRSANVTFSSYAVAVGSLLKGQPADSGGLKNISKYLNITTTNNSAPSWIYINISYDDGDVIGLSESSLKLYRYNGTGWELVPGSGVNTTANYVYGNVTSFSIFAPMGEPSTFCQELSTANQVYTLNQNVNSSGTCFTISATNVTINCAGYIINYSQGSSGYAVYSWGGYHYPTIKNCNIMQGVYYSTSTAIYISSSENGTILNNNITTYGEGSSSAVSISSNKNMNIAGNNIFTNGSNGAYGIYAYSGSNISVFNNNITVNGFTSSDAVDFDGAVYNSTISNNIIKVNGNSNGIYLSANSNYNNILNNIINCSSSLSSSGIRIRNSNYSFVQNNTVYSNSNAGTGIYLFPSSNNLIVNNTVFLPVPNSWEFSSTSPSLNNTIINLYLQSANISFTSLNIKIRSVLSGQPADSGGFYNISKYLNITNNSASSWVFLNISYNDLDIPAGISESSLKLYRYNSSNVWQLVAGSGVNTTANYVYGNVTNQTGFSIFAPMGVITNLTACKTSGWAADTTYNLGSNVNSSGTCMQIDANNVTLDCIGYIINYSQAVNGYGVNSSGYNFTTIKNCNIMQGDNSINTPNGIYLNSSNNQIINSTIIGRGIGVFLSSKNNAITNSSVNISGLLSSGYGIYILSAVNNTIINSKVNVTGSGSYGLYISSSNNTIITNSNFSETSGNAGIYFTSSHNNVITGSNISTTGATDAIAFSSSSNNNNITGSNVVGGNRGVYIGSSNNNTISNSNVTSTGGNAGIQVFASQNNRLVGLNVRGAPGVYLTSSSNNTLINNSNITGAGNSGISIDIFSSNNTLSNSNASSDASRGIFVSASSNNLFTNMKATGFSQGIYLTSSSNNTVITGSTISGGGATTPAIAMDLSSNNNTVSNSSVISGNGISVSSSLNNQLINLTVSGGGVQNGASIFSSNNTVLAGSAVAGSTGYGLNLTSSFNVTISNTNISGFNNGFIISSSNNNTISNSKVISLFSGQGISVLSSSNNQLINVNVSAPSWDFYSSGNSANNIILNMMLGNTNVSFIGLDMALKSKTSGRPADPSGLKNISKYINMTNNSASSWAFINVSYNDSDIPLSVSEFSLKLYRYNSSNAWELVPGSGVNTTANYVYGNITNFSIFAPMGGSANAAPNVTLNLPANNAPINDTQTVTFNFTATDDNNLTLSCDIYLDSVLNKTNSTTLNNTLTNFVISGLSYANHNWSVNCTDGSLSNVSETRYFSVVNTSILNACKTSGWEENKTYYLINNVNSSGTCFSIDANNVTIDCDGYMINYSQVSSGYGFNISGYNNITIKNCNIVQENSTILYAHSIYLENSNNADIQNNTFRILTLYGDGILLNSSLYSNILENTITIYNGDGYGIDLREGSNLSVAADNHIIVNGSGGRAINIESSPISNITNNNITTYGAGNYGINIYNSDSSILRNNILNITGDSSNYGVYIDSSTNSNITDNMISTAGSGNEAVYLYSSSDSFVLNNSIKTYSASSHGISLQSAFNTTIANNSIETTESSDGIRLTSGSDWNILENNSIITWSNGKGIYLDSSSNINITLNNLYTDSGTSNGIYLVAGSNNVLVSSNIIYSSVYGIYSDSNSDLNATYNDISGGNGCYLESNTNSILENNNISVSSYGIYLYSSSNNLIANNITSSDTSGYGIYLQLASDSNLTHNIISTTGDYSHGIYADSSTNLNLTNNTASTLGSYAYSIYLTSGAGSSTLFENNVFTDGYESYGIFLESGSDSNLDSNIINTTNTYSYGIYASSSPNNNLTNNLIATYGDWAHGIYLVSSPNSNITNNTMDIEGVDSSYGIYSYSSDSNIVEGNIITTTGTNNNDYGIYVESSSYSNITNNVIITDSSEGIYLFSYSDSNSLINNNITTLNAGNGIYLESSSNNNITDNIINQSWDGISLNINSDYNIIDKNIIRGKDLSNGIYLSSSNYVNITNNIVRGYFGIDLDSGYGSIVINNNITEDVDSASGIYLYSHSDSNIINNTIYLNGIDSYGISVYYSDYNNLLNNTITAEERGIYLESSSNNNLTNNIVFSNQSWDFYSAYDSQNNNIINLSLRSANVSFTSLDIALDSVLADWPADSGGLYNISKYINMTNNSASSWVLMNISYNDSDLGAMDESTLKLYRYDGGWFLVNGSGADTVTNLVYSGNITNFSIFAPMGGSANNPPSITLNKPDNNTQINDTQTVTFNFTAADDLNTTLSCDIYLDNALNQTNSTTQNGTLTNFVIGGISYSNHNWSVNCTDGSLSNMSEMRYFSVNDTIAPNVNLIVPPEGLNTSITSITFNCTATDNTALSNITLYIWNSTNFAWAFTNYVSGTYNESYQSTDFFKNETYKWNCRAGDIVSNYAWATSNRTFTVDTIKPLISIVSPQNTTYNNRTQLVNISANDTNLDSIWFFNGTDNETYFTPVYVTFAEGSNTLYAYANDYAGNLNQTSKTFFVDTTPPNITIITPIEADIVGWTVLLRANVTDPNLDTVTFEIRNGTLTGDTIASGLMNDIGGNIFNSTFATNATWPYDTNLLNSTNLTMIIYANDSQGHNVSQSTYWVLDNTQPGIQHVTPTQAGNYFNSNFNLNIYLSNHKLNYTSYNITNESGVQVQFNSIDLAQPIYSWTDLVNVNALPEGNYTLTTYAIDSSRPQNSNTKTTWFYIDKTAPTIDILSPQNKSYNTTSIWINLTTSSNSVWFFNGTDNETYTGPVQRTFAEGSHKIYAYANDTAGNFNQTNVSFTVDLTAPLLSIVNPQSKAYNNATILVNISSNGDYVWFYNGLNNLTYTVPVPLTFFEGPNIVIAYANDSAGNMNQTNVTFLVDTIFPTISIVSPQNTSYNNRTQLVNISVNDTNLDSVWFFNGTDNETYFNPVMRTFAEGINTLYAYVNDSAGNFNSTAIVFTTDTIAPSIGIVSPQNTTYNNRTQLVNISSNGDYVWFFNGTANVTYTSPMYVDFSEGSNTLIAYANDTVGNLNSTYVIFTANTTMPYVNIISPQNTTYNNRTQLVNISSNGQDIWFFNGTGNETYSGPVQRTFSEGSNTLIAYANTTAGNFNYSSVMFIADTINPIIIFVAPTPGNGSVENQSSVFINISSNEQLSSAILEWQGVNESMSGSGTNWYKNKTSLGRGNYTYTVYGYDTATNMNVSETRSVSVFTNSIPTVDAPAITPATAYINDTLNCSTTVYDIDLDILSVNLTWYNGTVLYGSAVFAGLSNGTLASYALTAGVQARGEIWNCSVFANDGFNNSLLKSVARIISNAAPAKPTLINPANASIITWGSADLQYNSTDIENDTLTYLIFINDTFIANTTSTSWSLSLDLGNYTWYVVANDGNVNSTPSDVYSFEMKPSVCGDAHCFGGETCSSCSADCGSCGCMANCACAASTCVGSTCGDGCGGTCSGTLAPNCGSRVCGPVPNGCGSSCGTCLPGKICSDGQCITPCTENWTCGNWGSCVNNQQTRTCTDSNSCGTTNNRPPLTQTCVCQENWQCSGWSACVNGQQTQTCTDSNNCGTNVSKPETNKTCTLPACGDNTLFGQCSLTKPKYCENGSLIDQCSTCGCSMNEVCKPDGRCVVECASNQECKDLFGQKYKCENGQCVIEHAECYSDSDCSEGKYCRMGVCEPIQKRETVTTGPSAGLPAPPVPGECTSSWNCSEFSECKIKYSTADLLSLSAQSLVEGRQESACVDVNKCNVSTIRSRTCTKEVPIRVEREVICSENYIEVYSKGTDKLIARMRESSFKEVPRLDIDLSVTELSEKLECAHCFDGVKNLDEKSIDCGGADCVPCEAPAPPMVDVSKVLVNLRWWLISTLLLTLIIYLYNYLFIPLVRPAVPKIKEAMPFKEAEFPDMTFTPQIKPRSVHLTESDKLFDRLREQLKKIEAKTEKISSEGNVREMKKDIEENLSKIGRIIKEKKKIMPENLKLSNFESELQDVEKKLWDLDKKFRIRRN